MLSGLLSTSSSTTEPLSLTWLGNSLIGMVWSIDIELNELAAEPKSNEGASGNEHQKNSEKDKQVVADLVKKLLVREVFSSFVRHTEQFSRSPQELSNQVLAERGSTAAWFSLLVLALISRTGTSVKFGRGRAFCWSISTLCI